MIQKIIGILAKYRKNQMGWGAFGLGLFLIIALGCGSLIYVQQKRS